jgi:UDP-glucose:(heptosyl)LPS alpha-1,3-glucosyltransferase
MDELRKSRPQAELWVIGPEPSEVAYLFEGWTGGYRLVGWQGGDIPYQEFDLLLHPARAEPYGMVISEAMAAAVPVVVSDACGAAEQVDAGAGEVVQLAAPLARWVAAVDRQLTRAEPAPGFVRGWNEVAHEFIAAYSLLAGEKR